MIEIQYPPAEKRTKGKSPTHDRSDIITKRFTERWIDRSIDRLPSGSSPKGKSSTMREPSHRAGGVAAERREVTEGWRVNTAGWKKRETPARISQPLIFTCTHCARAARPGSRRQLASSVVGGAVCRRPSSAPDSGTSLVAPRWYSPCARSPCSCDNGGPGGYGRATPGRTRRTVWSSGTCTHARRVHPRSRGFFWKVKITSVHRLVMLLFPHRKGAGSHYYLLLSVTHVSAYVLASNPKSAGCRSNEKARVTREVRNWRGSTRLPRCISYFENYFFFIGNLRASFHFCFKLHRCLMNFIDSMLKRTIHV